ncbi:unnamed protein product [Mytilus coruscus]|uniref:Ig-like domain-containing protein n=1 Tax=Mytilus coruscus TaxID=42192 RepID=A0A6J8AKD0_MYTCO|nr:unnamed protein product [Mytilus coruscus]
MDCVPDVSTTPTYHELRGSNVSLWCYPNPGTSPPIRNVFWSMKIGGSNPMFKTIHINQNKFSGGDLQTPSMTISDLEAADNGIYRCNVKNAKGEGYSDSQLLTGDLPTVSIQNNNFYPKIGQSFNIPCTIGESTIVQWSRVRPRRKEVISLDSSKYSGGTIGNPSLTITSIVSSDNGEYQCCGENLYGGSCDQTILTPGNDAFSAFIMMDLGDEDVFLTQNKFSQAFENEELVEYGFFSHHETLDFLNLSEEETTVEKKDTYASNHSSKPGQIRLSDPSVNLLTQPTNVKCRKSTGLCDEEKVSRRVRCHESKKSRTNFKSGEKHLVGESSHRVCQIIPKTVGYNDVFEWHTFCIT